MAQYIVNMNNYPAGALSSSDWVFRQNNGGASATVLNSLDGNLIRTDATAVGTKVMAYTPIDNVNDVEALIKFRLASDVGKQGIVSLRYGGSTEATTTGYTLSGSVISGAGQLAIDEGATGYVAWTPWNYVTTPVYWVRFRVNGTSLKAKVWTDGTTEPSTWAIDVTNSAATSGSFSGFHQYQSSSVFYFAASFGTNGDTAPLLINSKTQSGVFSVNPTPPPSSAPAGGYSGGYGGIAGYGQGYGTAFVPTATTVDKTQAGSFRVSKTLDKTQLGQFRVRTTSDKNIAGKFNIRRTYTQTQLGAFRVSSEPLRAQTGTFRVRTTSDKNQTGRFLVSIKSTQTISGQFRVRKTIDRNQFGVFRVKKDATKNQSGIFDVKKTLLNTTSGQFRVSKRVDNEQFGKFNVRISSNKNQTGRFAIEIFTSKYQSGMFRVYDRNTIPEVVIKPDIYKPDYNSFGALEITSGESGDIRQTYKDGSGDISTETIEEGSLKQAGISYGTIRADDEFVVLLLEDGSVWWTENEYMVVQEYDKDDIISMISIGGIYKEGTPEYGQIPEAI